MLHGLVGNESAGGGRTTTQNQPRPKGSRNFHTGSDLSAQAKGPAGWQNQQSHKPPRVCCSSPCHGVWSRRDFQQKSWDDRWQLAKDKRLCFRCLAGDHKMCTLAITWSFACNRNYLTCCMGGGGISPPLQTTTTRNPRGSETNSLRTIPVWVRTKGKKIEVNVILFFHFIQILLTLHLQYTI